MTSRARIAGGIAVISLVQLGVELLFVKLSRYEFGTLSLGVVGLAMLGVALASPLTKLLGGTERASGRAVAILPLALLASGWYYFQLEHRITDAFSLYVRIVTAGSLSLVALALSSVPTYAEIVKAKGSVFAYYSASLAGATAGVCLAFGALYFFGDIPTYAIQIFACIVAVWIFLPVGLWRLWVLSGTVVLGFGSMFVFHAADTGAHPGSIMTRTNAFSRIDVQPYRGVYSFRTAGINGGTSTASGTVTNPPRRLITDLSALPYRVKPGEVLILGSGAGKNVTQALSHGATRVVAVEINEMIPQAMEQLLGPEENPYRDSRVELRVGEGREIAAELERNGARFDMVYVPVATLFGSSGHALTQTYLMTSEAISLYFDLLKPGGYVAIYFRSVIGDKLIRSVSNALTRRGIDTPGNHITAFDRGGKFVLIVRASQPIDGQLRSLLVQAPPGKDDISIEGSLIQSETLRRLSDDNPFLYNDSELLNLRRQMFGYNVDFMEYIAAIACLLLFLVLALSIHSAPNGKKYGRWGYISAFIVIGIAYSQYQTGMIQRLTFLVGHPLLATSLVLPAMLAGTAFGAWWSRTAFARHHAARRVSVAGILVVAIVLFAYTEPSSYILPSWPDWGRYGLAIVLSGVPSIMMGTFFPVIFARLELEDERATLWAWLANGTGGVLGAVLGIYSAMLLGFSITIALVLPLYAAVSGWDATAHATAKQRAAADRLLGGLCLAGLAGLFLVTGF